MGGRLSLQRRTHGMQNYLRMAMKDGYALDNVDHVSWLDPATLCAVARRAGLKISRFSGLSGMSTVSAGGRVAAWGVRTLASLGIFPLLDCKSILYEFVEE